MDKENKHRPFLFEESFKNQTGAISIQLGPFVWSIHLHFRFFERNTVSKIICIPTYFKNTACKRQSSSEMLIDQANFPRWYCIPKPDTINQEGQKDC